MKRRTKLVLWALLGLPLLAVVLLLAVALILGPVEPVPESEVFEVASAELRSLAGPPDAVPSDTGSPDTGRSDTSQLGPWRGDEVNPGSMNPPALHVSLTLEEGQFDVLPGEPGGPIRVDAQYDAGSFLLTHESATGPDGTRHFNLEFRRTAWMLRGLLSPQTIKLESRIRVFLPPDVPMNLVLRLSKGQHDVDLSGLAVRSLLFKTGMGQTNLTFDQPNPVSMELCWIRAGQGQLKARGLGHANARVLDFRGSMGESTLDFGGSPLGETFAKVRMSMGSARIRIPAERRVEYVATESFLGTVRRPELRSPPADRELEGTLTLDLGVWLGEIDVR